LSMKERHKFVLRTYSNNNFKSRVLKFRDIYKAGRKWYHIIRISNYTSLTDFVSRTQIRHLYKINGAKKKIIQKVNHLYLWTYFYTSKRKLKDNMFEHINILSKLKRAIYIIFFGK
jgi:hypothetical protein